MRAKVTARAAVPVNTVSANAAIYAAATPLRATPSIVSNDNRSTAAASKLSAAATTAVKSPDASLQASKDHRSTANAAKLSVAAKAAANSLDGSLQAAVRAAAPPTRLLMLAFGNAKVGDHLRNFCTHAKRAGIAHIAGAVDTSAFNLLVAHGVPTYLTPLAKEKYQLDGSNSHSSSSWKRFASMRTGEVARLVLLGYDVLHSDTDVVWLRDPTPYLMCTAAAHAGEFSDASRFPCAQLQTADVAVSSDNMGPGRAAKGGAAYHASGTFNSGILLFRTTARGRAFVAAWHRNVASPAARSRFYRLTSDQQVFNGMVRKERTWPGVGGQRDSWLMDTIHPDWQGNLTLGALPLPLFANGHGYFVQSAHRALDVSPFAAHATYTLDYHDGPSKRQRFREAGLWTADPPPEASERFLVVNASSGELPFSHSRIVSHCLLLDCEFPAHCVPSVSSPTHPQSRPSWPRPSPPSSGEARIPTTSACIASR